jgi:hypothetical protein
MGASEQVWEESLNVEQLRLRSFGYSGCSGQQSRIDWVVAGAFEVGEE